jgi:hypothetical protein
MKGLRRYSHVALLLLSLLSSTAVPIATHADTILGRFTLTSEARWGSTVLPPGQYTYSIAANAVMPIVIVRSVGGDLGVFVVPVSMTDAREGDPDKLVLEKTNGGMVVTSLFVKDMGVIFHYRVPKPMLETAAKALDPKLAASLQAK